MSCNVIIIVILGHCTLFDKQRFWLYSSCKPIDSYKMAYTQHEQKGLTTNRSAIFKFMTVVSATILLLLCMSLYFAAYVAIDNHHTPKTEPLKANRNIIANDIAISSSFKRSVLSMATTIEATIIVLMIITVVVITISYAKVLFF